MGNSFSLVMSFELERENLFGSLIECAFSGDPCVGKTSVINPENLSKNYEMVQ